MSIENIYNNLTTNSIDTNKCRMSQIHISKTYLGEEIISRFCQACEKGDVSTVNKILRFKVSPNAKDEFGMSAISKASAGRKFHFFYPFFVQLPDLSKTDK